MNRFKIKWKDDKINVYDTHLNEFVDSDFEPPSAVQWLLNYADQANRDHRAKAFPPLKLVVSNHG